MNIRGGQVTLSNFTKNNKTRLERKVREIEPELPEGWRTIEIGRAVKEFRSGFACSKKYAKESGIPHLRPNNIGFYGELNLSQLVFLPAEMVDLSKYSLKEGDVLFNNTNSKELVGRASLVKQNLECGFSNHITRLRVNKELITSEWLVHCINYLWLEGFFLKLCRKWIGQAGVNTKMLKSTIIPLPPLEEQSRLVASIEEIMSRIGQAKKLREEALKDTEATMQSALHQIFSKAEEKRWKITMLKNVAETTSGGTPRRSVRDYFGGSIPWVKSGELEDNIILKTEETITEKGVKNSSAKLFPVGTLLVAMYGATVGKTGILGIKAATNQAICAIFPKEEVINKYFIQHFIIWKRQELIQKSFGGAQPNISQKVIRNLEIPIPSIEEQEKIVTYLNQLREKVKKLREYQVKTNEEIEATRQAMVSKAFSGEL